MDNPIEAEIGEACIVPNCIYTASSSSSCRNGLFSMHFYQYQCFFLSRYVRSKELFMRWCELAAFSVMYRSHLGTLPAENWQFDSDIETTSHFFNMSIVFQSWDFYRNDLMNEASAKGWPIARPMFLVYPDNTAMYSNSLWFQFMIGTELLIAPVYQKGKTSVQVILPKGVMWVHLWTGKSIQGI